MSLIYARSVRGTVFSVSLRGNFYGGVMVVREIYLLVVVGALFVNLYGLENLKFVYATPASIVEGNVLIILSVSLLLIFIGLFSRTLFPTYLCLDTRIPHIDKPCYQARCLLRALAVLILCLTVLAHILGARHAFLGAILSGSDLLAVRLANRYGSGVPTHVISFLTYSFVLFAAVLGVFGARSISALERVLYVSTLAYATTLSGEKAFPVQALLLYAAGYVYSRQFPPSRVLVFLFAMVVLVATIIVLAVGLQYPDMNLEGFIEYAADRLGAGQVQGVYEEFALRLSSWRYLLTEIPFSGVFTDARVFSKDLMMNVYGRTLFDEEIGLLNSLFIGEAFAIGGYWGVLLSPIAVAFNFTLATAFAIRVLGRGMEIPAASAKMIGVLFISSISMFTGDLNGMLVGKKIVAVALYLGVLYCIFTLMNGKRYPIQKRRVAPSL